MSQKQWIIDDELYRAAVRGNWEPVVDAYTKYSHEIIENSKTRRDTALHVAAANGQTMEVLRIIEDIPSQDNLLAILRMRNGQGNTPLHLAAATGSLDMCCCIMSSKEKSLTDEMNDHGRTSLIAEKNDKGETPIFLAAHHGHEMVFLYLQHCYGKVEEHMLINNDCDTVLHSAIYGEAYRLAIRIIRSHQNLVDKVNGRHLTPLHVLALQPHSFPSSVHLGLFHLIFYKCMYFRPYTLEEPAADFKEIEQSIHRAPICPPNYKICYNDLYDTVKNVFRTIFGPVKKRAPEKNVDHENQPSLTFCHAVYNILLFIMFVPLHLRSNWKLLSLSQMGRKHRLAEQLLDELLHRVSVYKPKDDSEIRQEHPASSVSKCTSGEPTQGTKNDLEQWSTHQLLDELLRRVSGDNAKKPSNEPHVRKETPLLTAAKLGIVEMVDKILDKFPEAIEDKDFQHKNAVLLAAENRQRDVYMLLESKRMVHASVFSQVDVDDNSTLHLASRYNPERAWHTPGPALQIKWEAAWNQYVQDSMPSNSFLVRNKKGETAEDIYLKSHKNLIKEGKDWLTKTCQAYSTIATLIATVAFGTSSTIPGSYNEGKPALENEFAFTVFSISSLIALCTALSATVFFLAILISRTELEDFAKTVPGRLQLGLKFLFASIASMLVSFSSGFYFSVRYEDINAAYLIFAVICLPITLFAISQLPLYYNLSAVIFSRAKRKSNLEHQD